MSNTYSKFPWPMISSLILLFPIYNCYRSSSRCSLRFVLWIVGLYIDQNNLPNTHFIVAGLWCDPIFGWSSRRWWSFSDLDREGCHNWFWRYWPQWLSSWDDGNILCWGGWNHLYSSSTCSQKYSTPTYASTCPW